MINFFRKIRYKLADNNKPMKYIRYAIGEILLVVIGILIALQINNLNQNLKEKQIEQKLLKSLKMEITSNIIHFEEGIKFHINSKKMNVAILKEFSNSNHRINDDILDSLVESASAPIILNPQLGVVKSILATGDIKLIKNELIVQYITMFEDKIKNVTGDFDRLIGVWNQQLWPRENLHIRRINRAYSNNDWLGVDLPRGSFNSDYDSFFKDIVLENAYMLTLYEQTKIINSEESLLNQMKSVLKIVDSELLISNYTND